VPRIVPVPQAGWPEALVRRSGQLLQVLGVGFGLAVTIGNTIGAGILRAPGEVARHLPDPGLFLLAWVLGGLYALLGAIQIAELAAMLPRSGGQYVFARHALGEYAGFIVGWSDWLSVCGTVAAVSIVIGDFSAALLPGLRGRETTIALSVALLFAVTQWRGIHWASLIQNVTSLAKAAAFLALVAAAFVLGAGSSSAAGAAVRPDLAMASALLLSLQGVIYTYDGWTGPVYFSEEIDDPGRNVPRALFGGVLSVIAIYLLVNVSFLYVLPVERIAGEEFAAGAVAEALFGATGDTLLRALTVLSLLSAVNANHLMASRTLYGMSRDGLFSARAAVVNQGGTPSVALGLGTAVALLFIVLGRSFEQVITVLAFFFVANYTISFTSVFVLRRREPARPRPYRAWGYPWTTAAALIGSVAFLLGAVAADTRNSLYALLLLGVSYPMFQRMRSREATQGPQ
jgi:basic amino acid/polyamine antiporter, APA family